MDGEARRVDISLARTFLYKKEPSEEEMDLAISLLENMPKLGHKGLGILTLLRKRKEELFSF